MGTAPAECGCSRPPTAWRDSYGRGRGVKAVPGAREVLVDSLRGQRGFVVNPRRGCRAAVQADAFILRLPQLIDAAWPARGFLRLRNIPTRAALFWRRRLSGPNIPA